MTTEHPHNALGWRGQMLQDCFVAHTLRKVGGTYADIGAGDPLVISNTHALHHELRWTGICCEKDPVHRANLMNDRGDCFEDAFRLDWNQVRLAHADRAGYIDFLSLDLEPPDLTLAALTIMLGDPGAPRFRLACIEHDAYRDGGEYRMRRMTELMQNAGYIFANRAGLLGPDDSRRMVEDWWYCPRQVRRDDVGRGLDAVARAMQGHGPTASLLAECLTSGRAAEVVEAGVA